MQEMNTNKSHRMLDLETFNCCGCAACANICPKKAIKMIPNEQGYYVPFIDESLCVQCGLCQRTCPQLNKMSKYPEPPQCFAVMAEDSIREKSSSGGVFSVVAQEILNRKGYVCGAAFDEHWCVKHIIIDNLKDLSKLRGSKYVQSFVSEQLMRTIKNYLQQEKWVLFSGTPCQVAGLKAYLGKDYKTLLLIDVICSKVPSKKVFDKFLHDNYDISTIRAINFRSKENGWNCSATTTTTTTTTYKSTDYMKCFLNSLAMNEACVHCNYMSTKRVSDITIGDFWRIKNLREDLDDDKGTSIVLLNTEKGEAIFNSLAWKRREPMSIKNAIYSNRALLIPFIPHQNRKFFVEELNTLPFNELVNKLLSTKYNVGVLNWWWNSNRGAILTCYAGQEIVRELGYYPCVIKSIPFYYYHQEYQQGISKKFANKHLNLTEWVHSRIDMRRLNEQFDTFMVGSDQVWNHDLNWFLQDFYYLNFVNLNKNKIACAASFGKFSFTGNDTVKEMVSYYLSRFNHISVREQEAIALLETIFSTTGTVILDPVFLIDPKKYEKLAASSGVAATSPHEYIAFYFIHSSPKKLQVLQKLARSLNLKTIDIKDPACTVEDWLYYIQHASLVVSDSFHASAFSIIFHKKFITLMQDTRMKQLKDITSFSHRFMRENDTLDINRIMKEEDWTVVEQKLSVLKHESITWLKQALENRAEKNSPKSQKQLEAFYASLDDRLNYVEGMCVKLQGLVAQPAKKDGFKVPPLLGNLICCFMPKSKNRKHFRKYHIKY